MHLSERPPLVCSFAWQAALLCAASACSANQSSDGPIAIDDFCLALDNAGCDVGQRCKTTPADRAACLTFLEDTWDACPMAQDAQARGEVTYDPDAARTLVDMTRSASCEGYPVPDWVSEVPVFAPLLGAGQTCHSKVSCTDGLTCVDLTVSTPEGTCAAP